MKRFEYCALSARRFAPFHCKYPGDSLRSSLTPFLLLCDSLSQCILKVHSCPSSSSVSVGGAPSPSKNKTFATETGGTVTTLGSFSPPLDTCLTIVCLSPLQPRGERAAYLEGLATLGCVIVLWTFRDKGAPTDSDKEEVSKALAPESDGGEDALALPSKVTQLTVSLTTCYGLRHLYESLNLGYEYHRFVESRRGLKLARERVEGWKEQKDEYEEWKRAREAKEKEKAREEKDRRAREGEGYNAAPYNATPY